MSAKTEAIKVFARFRPLNGREERIWQRCIADNEEYDEEQVVPFFINGDWVGIGPQSANQIDKNISLYSEYPFTDRSLHTYSFDSVHWQTDQKTFFEYCGLPSCRKFVEGMNCTIFAYGQTGSGKSFSMFGKEPELTDERGKPLPIEKIVLPPPALQGLIPRSISFIFAWLASQKVKRQRTTVSVYEIYIKNSVKDLLSKGRQMQIVELKNGVGIFAKNCNRKELYAEMKKARDDKKYQNKYLLKEEKCAHLEEVLHKFVTAQKYRTVKATAMNAHSSRGHCVMIFRMICELKNGKRIRSKFTFADLAGSEIVKKTGATADILEEAKAINSSLSVLGRVITALATGRGSPPFKDSALSHCLKDALAGNSRTSLVVAASPHEDNITESISSFNFATRCKMIKTKTIQPIQLSPAQMKKEIKKLKEKIKKMRMKLSPENTLQEFFILVVFEGTMGPRNDAEIDAALDKWRPNVVKLLEQIESAGDMQPNLNCGKKGEDLYLSVGFEVKEGMESKNVQQIRDDVYKEMKNNPVWKGAKKRKKDPVTHGMLDELNKKNSELTKEIGKLRTEVGELRERMFEHQDKALNSEKKYRSSVLFSDKRRGPKRKLELPNFELSTLAESSAKSQAKPSLELPEFEHYDDNDKLFEYLNVADEIAEIYVKELTSQSDFMQDPLSVVLTQTHDLLKDTWRCMRFFRIEREEMQNILEINSQNYNSLLEERNEYELAYQELCLRLEEKAVEAEQFKALANEVVEQMEMQKSAGAAASSASGGKSSTSSAPVSNMEAHLENLMEKEHGFTERTHRLDVLDLDNSKGGYSPVTTPRGVRERREAKKKAIDSLRVFGDTQVGLSDMEMRQSLRAAIQGFSDEDLAMLETELGMLRENLSIPRGDTMQSSFDVEPGTLPDAFYKKRGPNSPQEDEETGGGTLLSSKREPTIRDGAEAGGMEMPSPMKQSGGDMLPVFTSSFEFDIKSLETNEVARMQDIAPPVKPKQAEFVEEVAMMDLPDIPEKPAMTTIVESMEFSPREPPLGTAPDSLSASLPFQTPGDKDSVHTSDEEFEDGELKDKTRFNRVASMIVTHREHLMGHAAEYLTALQEDDSSDSTDDMRNMSTSMSAILNVSDMSLLDHVEDDADDLPIRKTLRTESVPSRDRIESWTDFAAHTLHKGFETVHRNLDSVSGFTDVMSLDSDPFGDSDHTSDDDRSDMMFEITLPEYDHQQVFEWIQKQCDGAFIPYVGNFLKRKVDGAGLCRLDVCDLQDDFGMSETHANLLLDTIEEFMICSKGLTSGLQMVLSEFTERDLRRMYTFRNSDPGGISAEHHSITYEHFCELFPEMDRDLSVKIFSSILQTGTNLVSLDDLHELIVIAQRTDPHSRHFKDRSYYVDPEEIFAGVVPITAPLGESQAKIVVAELRSCEPTDLRSNDPGVRFLTGLNKNEFVSLFRSMPSSAWEIITFFDSFEYVYSKIEEINDGNPFITLDRFVNVMKTCNIQRNAQDYKIAFETIGIDYSTPFEYEVALECMKHPQSDVEQLRHEIISACRHPHIQRSKLRKLEFDKGDEVILIDGRRGTIHFKGELHSEYGVWLGIILDPDFLPGNSDGVLDGKTYFVCGPNEGVFIPVADVHMRLTKRKMQQTLNQNELKVNEATHDDAVSDQFDELEDMEKELAIERGKIAAEKNRLIQQQLELTRTQDDLDMFLRSVEEKEAELVKREINIRMQDEENFQKQEELGQLMIMIEEQFGQIEMEKQRLQNLRGHLYQHTGDLDGLFDSFHPENDLIDVQHLINHFDETGHVHLNFKAVSKAFKILDPLNNGMYLSRKEFKSFIPKDATLDSLSIQFEQLLEKWSHLEVKFIA